MHRTFARAAQVACRTLGAGGRGLTARRDPESERIAGDLVLGRLHLLEPKLRATAIGGGAGPQVAQHDIAGRIGLDLDLGVDRAVPHRDQKAAAALPPERPLALVNPTSIHA